MAKELRLYSMVIVEREPSTEHNNGAEIVAALTKLTIACDTKLGPRLFAS